MMFDDIAVVIPAHNEATTIRNVVLGVLNYTSKVIVIDDGSTDGTAKTIADLGIEIIANASNLGKSASLAAGFNRALAMDVNAIITVDADSQHNPADIPAFVTAILEYPDTIIIGARVLSKAKAPRKSRIGNVIADFFISWATNTIITDTQSGFKCYPIEFLRQINWNKKIKFSFLLESYLLLEAERLGFSFSTVPIHAFYSKDIRPSHYRPWAHTLPIINMITWHIIFRGFRLPGLAKSFKHFVKGN